MTEKRIIKQDEFYSYILGEKISDNEDFIESDVDDVLRFRNCIFEFDDSFLTGLEFKFDITFENCEFRSEEQGGLFFLKWAFETWSFNNCIFYSNLRFISCNGSILLQDSCKFIEDVCLENCSDLKRLDVSGCVFEEDLKVLSWDSKDDESPFINISTNTLKKNLIFEGYYSAKLKIESNTIDDSLVLGEKTLKPFCGKYEQLSSFKQVSITGGSINNRLTIYKAEFHSSFVISSETLFVKWLEIKESIFNEEFILAHASFSLVNIYGGKFKDSVRTHFAKIKEIYISGGCIEKFEIKEGYLERVYVEGLSAIDNLKLSEKFLRIDNVIIEQSNPVKILIKGNRNKSGFELNAITFNSLSFHKDSVFQVYEIELCKIHFLYFVNFGNIIFNDVLFKPGQNSENFSFSIVNSDLGKTSFLDCEEEKQSNGSYVFVNSRILESYFSNEVIPENIEILKGKEWKNISPKERARSLSKQKEILFNQLRKLNEGKSNLALAMHYKALSHNAKIAFLYYSNIPPAEELTRSIKGYKYLPFLLKFTFFIFYILYVGISLIFTIVLLPFNRKRRNDFFEFLTLCLNKVTNNHGKSWQRALFWLLFVIVSSYYTYCRLSGIELGNIYNSNHVEQFYKISSYIGDFLNPIPKERDTFDSFYDGDASIKVPERNLAQARFFALLSKIIIAYFVYQFIQAFRRFGRG